MDRAYGRGDEHGVCVFYSLYEGGGGLGGSTCTPYQDTGVYTPYFVYEGEISFLAMYPDITDNSPYKNTVHGIAFTP
jgi:hypothetical protein